MFSPHSLYMGSTPSIILFKKRGVLMMISCSLIVLFALVSMLGGIVFFVKMHEKTVTQWMVVGFFLMSHGALFIFGVVGFFAPSTSLVLLVIIGLIFLARFLNGRILFGRNHLQHYAVNGAIMLIIFLLYHHSI
jgi:hypothetical protein